MKTSIVKALLLTFSIMTAMGSTAQASGDGRSGDDHAGISIPTSIDHGLEYKDFDYAVSYCVDKAATSLFNQMTRLNLPNPPTIFRKDFNGATYKFVANGHAYMLNLHVGVEFEGLNLTQSAGFELSEAFVVPANVLNVVVSDEVDLMLKRAVEAQSSFAGGLQINIQTKKDSGYDELSTFRKDKLIVSRYEVSSTAIARKLEQNETRATSLRLDAKQFTQCLQYNLEKDQ